MSFKCNILTSGTANILYFFDFRTSKCCLMPQIEKYVVMSDCVYIQAAFRDCYSSILVFSLMFNIGWIVCISASIVF
jgi:hypothetical protein